MVATDETKETEMEEDFFARVRALYDELKAADTAGLSAKAVAFRILALDALSQSATFAELSVIEQAAALASRSR